VVYTSILKKKKLSRRNLRKKPLSSLGDIAMPPPDKMTECSPPQQNPRWYVPISGCDDRRARTIEAGSLQPLKIISQQENSPHNRQFIGSISIPASHFPEQSVRRQRLWRRGLGETLGNAT